MATIVLLGLRLPIAMTSAFSMFTIQRRGVLKGVPSALTQRRSVSSTLLTSQQRLYGSGSSSSNDADGNGCSSSAVHPSSTFTPQELMNEAIQRLQKSSIDDPELSVYHLMAEALDLSWETGWKDVVNMKNNEMAISTEQLQFFEHMVQRRLKHEPLQYILGKWDFLDYTLDIEAPLLCPRPETEELVQFVLKDIRTNTMDSTIPLKLKILDVGCGTGAIGIALSHQLDSCKVTAIDIDPVAVRVSNQNAQRILTPDGTSNNIYQALLKSAQEYQPPNDDDELFDIVVSNPPYIPSDAPLSKTVLDYESHDALFGGGVDGMNVIRIIIQQLPRWCRKGAICWMEVDPSQPAKIQQELLYATTNNVGVEFVSSHEDFCARHRFVKLRVL